MAKMWATAKVNLFISVDKIAPAGFEKSSKINVLLFTELCITCVPAMYHFK